MVTQAKPVKNSRGKKAPAQGTLFDTKPLTKPARAPLWVITELVNLWGIPAKTARAYPSNVAFAILYRARNNGAKCSPEAVRARALACAKRMREAAADSEFDTQNLCDLLNESASYLDRDLLARVCAGIANLIDPPECSS